MTRAIVVFDIDGVIRDVGQSYRRAIADTVAEFTRQAYRPTLAEIDQLKTEGIWNNDWEASQELIYRYFESQGIGRSQQDLDYNDLVDFFQTRYRGDNFNGYIANEPLLATPEYFQNLSQNDIAWGFFSGATRGSAEYVLKRRLGLSDPLLIAMEDAPSKPDPTGLFGVLKALEGEHPRELAPVFYAGDTVADMYTITKAQQVQPQRQWYAVGILPPHVQTDTARCEAYAANLNAAGAKVILNNVQALTASQVRELL
ncbi:MAG: TIGR01548 family HAD-type hydrolase [Jaaginema sp. PMC 1079.18]|nr:TIGR01548 family HAD-type hydrolase [Jaaginema sp. PMC 1080.18]MEC4852470.1 TIGR01548 family HAD-type hydrolase [Jaaginema sp. PMC 1079.18]MEC4864756.1 TIGR01548 family HAD-type hydrolase [Jaaginema sp. PMC 1078.18]